MGLRSGLDSYTMTAEVRYRYFEVRAVGDYDALRQGKRSWLGLLYGAPRSRPRLPNAALPKRASTCIAQGHRCKLAQ